MSHIDSAEKSEGENLESNRDLTGPGLLELSLAEAKRICVASGLTSP